MGEEGWRVIGLGGGSGYGEGGGGAFVFEVLFSKAPLPLRSAGFDFRGELLAAREFGNRERVEPVDGFAIREHEFEDMVQLARKTVFSGPGGGRARGPEQAFVRDGFEVLGVRSYEIVERALGLRNGGLELVPGGLDDFEEDVVLELIYEMDHLGHAASRGFPITADLLVDVGEHTTSSCHATPPCAAEGKLDALDAPKELENFEILAAGPGSDNDIDRGVDLVV